MILESTQLLYTANHENGGTENIKTNAPICLSTGNRGYKSHSKNHPSALWVRESLAHYWWLLALAKELVVEHGHRFMPKKPHASLVHLEWLEANPPPELLTKTVWIRDPTPAMPVEFRKEGDVIASYRAYYNGAKRDAGLLKYTKRHVPHILASKSV
jgi:hypothetical protein